MFVLHTFGTLALELDGRPASGSLSQKRKSALLAILAASGEDDRQLAAVVAVRLFRLPGERVESRPFCRR